MNQTAPADLYNRIINKINQEHKIMIIKRRLLWYSGGFVLSFSLLLPILAKLYLDINKSGMFAFLSLLFTDFKLIWANIGDFTWSILESLPVTSMVLTIGFLILSLLNISKFLNYYLQMRELEGQLT
jgi:hypothetical protein